MKIMAYIIVALFLAVGGLSVALYQTTKTQSAKIAVLENDLKQSQAALDEIVKSVALSDKIIQSMSGSLSRIAERGSIIGERLSMLEKNNVEIRNLLATVLPVDGCLLDNSCRRDEVPATERGAAPSVRGTPNQAGGNSTRPGDEQ